MLAQLGAVLLLFEMGLHFSLEHLRKQAADILAFGPLQVALTTLALARLHRAKAHVRITFELRSASYRRAAN